LSWVDLLELNYGSFTPPRAIEAPRRLPDLVSCIAMRARGGMVAAVRDGLAAFDPARMRLTRLIEIEADLPRNRPNDGRCDRAGRMWIGTMAMDAAAGQGSLYRIDADLSVTRMDSGFGVSNGVGWSPDDRWMYFVDSRAQAIYRYPFDATRGALGKREIFVDLSAQQGNPAGIAVDSEGFVWSAIWDGWAVMRFAPTGRVDRVVRLPAPRPTSCAFGGRGLRTLFITTARTRLSRERLAEAPLSGSILALDTEVAGQAETPFRG
jgi:sugar lactone lactonase YvrE